MIDPIERLRSDWFINDQLKLIQFQLFFGIDFFQKIFSLIDKSYFSVFEEFDDIIWSPWVHENSRHCMVRQARGIWIPHKHTNTFSILYVERPNNIQELSLILIPL